MDERPIAEVILRQGRWWLVVRGLFLAMEADICRDPQWTGSLSWTHAMLEDAARLIDENRFVDAATRWNTE